MNWLNGHIGEKPRSDSPVFLPRSPCGCPVRLSINPHFSAGGFATHPCPLRRWLHFFGVSAEKGAACAGKWDLPLFIKALLNESSEAAGIGWAGEHPRDCLAEAARPRFIHRNVGMLASLFIHTHRISFTSFAVSLAASNEERRLGAIGFSGQ